MAKHEEFRDQVEAFLGRHNIGAATLGSQALKDPKFVSDLRRGRSPSLRTMDRVTAWMTDYETGPGADAAPDSEAMTPPRDHRQTEAGTSRRGRRGAVVAVAVVAATALGWFGWSYLAPVARDVWAAWRAAPADAPPQDTAQAVTGPRDAVATLEERLAQSLRERDTLDTEVKHLSGLLAGISDRLATLEQSAAAPDDGGAEAGAAEATWFEFDQRLGRLEQTSLADPAASNIDRETLASMQSGMAGLDRRAAALETRLGALESSGGASLDVAPLLAFTRLAGAVRSTRPFAGLLGVLRSMLAGHDGTSAVSSALATLGDHAAAGVPSGSQLRARFPDVVTNVLRAEAAGGDRDWYWRALGRLRAIVTIRRRGNLEGGSAEAVLARAEAAVAAADFGRAADELDGLGGAAAGAAAGWRGQARAHSRGHAALGTLERAILERLVPAATRRDGAGDDASDKALGR